MFKWLKKVMISIINAIKSLFVGDKPVQSVSIGDHQVYSIGDDLWPTVPSGERWRIATLSLQYSSGSKLNAAGSNYVEIVATVYKYLSDSTTAYETTTISCPLETDTSWIELRNSDTRAYGKDRGAQDPSTSAGAERTGTIRAIRPTSSRYQVSGQASDEQFGQNYTVTQQSNSKSAYPGYINMFTVADAYAEGDDPNNTGTRTLTLDENSITCPYTVSGTGGWIYASGYISQASRVPQWEVVGVKGNDLLLSWIRATPDTSDYQSGDITFESLSSGSRSGYIKVYDSACPEVYLRIPVTQAANSYTLTFYSTGNVNITSDSTSFSINVVPKNGGTLVSDASAVSVRIQNTSSNPISNLAAGTSTLENNSYVRVPFTCSANTSTTNKSASIIFSYGGRAITATVTQERYHPIPSFFSQAIQADNNPDWWIGTVNYNGTSNGIYIYCENEITEKTRVSIALSWKGEKFGTTYDCEEQGIENIIQPHSSFGIGGSSRPGYWLVSADAGETIDSSFTITEFDVDTGMLYIF